MSLSSLLYSHCILTVKYWFNPRKCPTWLKNCWCDLKPYWIDYCSVKMLCSGPELNFFSCSTQLSMKFIILINVKMPTIVGILTFISMANTTSERLKAVLFFSLLVFISSCNFMLSIAEHEKMFITSVSVLFTVSLYNQAWNLTSS